jgi:hypothetical protein
MNKLWLRMLLHMNRWTCRRMRAAVRREKVRWFKRQLKRQDLWKN